MAKNVGGKGVGAWAFLVGVLIVLILAVFDLQADLRAWAMAIILLVGIVVGFMNVSKSESSKFIMAALALAIGIYTAGGALSSLSAITFLNIGAILQNILDYLMLLIVPALVIVALKSVFEVAKN